MTKLDIDVCRATGPGVEIRADGEDSDQDVMQGHFSTFNDWYEINSFFEGNFLERIAPGAFKRTFKAAQSAKDKHRISVLLEHGFDPAVGDKPLGVPDELEEDSEGARYSVPLFDTSYNRDLLPALRAGAYGSSFRFGVIKDEWDNEPPESEHNPKQIPERTIKEVRVAEFGPTVFPANPSADAGLRSATDEYYEKLRTRNEDVFQDVVARAAKARGLPADKLLVGSEDHSGSPDESKKETESTDPSAKHSEDSRSEVEPTSSPTNSTDSQREHSEQPGTDKTQDKEKKLEENERMTVSARRERVREIESRKSEIDAEFAGGELPDETQGEWDTLTEELDQHDRAIAAAEARRADLEARAAATEGKGTERAKPAGTRPAPQVAKRRVDDVYDLNEYRREARSLDDLGELYRDGARRAIEEARIPGVGVDTARAKEQAETLLETVDDEKGTLARRILVTGSPVYRRAFGKAATALTTGGLTTEEQRALALGAGANGAFAVPFQLDPTIILTSDGQINPLRRMARVEQIVGKEWQGVTSAGVSVTRVAEATEATDDSPTLAQPSVKTERVQGFIPFSNEIDASWSALQSSMVTLLADAKEAEEAESFVNGDGTGLEPGGVVGSLGGGQVVDTAGPNLFAPADVYAVKNAVPPRFRARGQFLAETSTYDLVRQFDESNGSNMWVQLADATPGRLVGYSAEEVSTMTAATPAAGEQILLFGDFKQFLIVDRVGMSVELIPHLFGGTANYPTGERGLFAIWHNNAVVLVPGAFRVLQVPAA